MTALTLEAVRKSYGRTPVLHGIDLEMAAGEMVVVVGASGCGKSTLLRLVAGLEMPDSGRIVLDGRDITGHDPAARDIAMVFQHYALYPHMSVFDNMAYALKVRRLPRAEIAARVGEAAQMLHLTDLLDRRPRELSGGQRQRVAIGRAVVRKPRLFLFDEPLSSLDARLRTSMRAEIKRLQRSLGVTSLYVTHDQHEAMTLGDRLLVLNAGRTAQLGRPMDVYARPADICVAELIGALPMNLLPARLRGDGAALLTSTGDLGLELAVPLPRAPGRDADAVVIGIRPEDVEIAPGAPPGAALPFELDAAQPLGAEVLLIGRLDGGIPFSLRAPAGAYAAGARMHLTCPTARLHVFAAATGQRIGA
ncbi:sn-glycerol-3-phosphate ABC transporter ATP-binding protein UgpC [Xanthobacter sp. V4C-4]|uniref:ABC transporter ATP-binding protein n=1 Tax=Xanthobacter cornucopiae TaxID=3119924 RepID=UPI0037294142